MSRTAVQFGAGNIGRGFLAELFHESGLEVAFVDVNAPMVDAINSAGRYVITIVGSGAAEVSIDAIRAVDGRDTVRVAAEVAAAEIVCTAVGAGALPYIAPVLAAGLAERHRLGNGPVNILLCENLHNAANYLRTLVTEYLPAEVRAQVLADTGFVHAVVSRMVPLRTEQDAATDLLGIRVEAYKRLPVDAHAVVGKLPEIVGVELSDRFAALEERKLYTHNGAHAVLGYLGHAAGFEFACSALEEVAIRKLLRQSMAETGEALVRRHGFDPVEQAAHHEDLLARFANRSLGDTCRRLARDPVRKLAPADRLVGAARMCEAEDVEPEAVSRVIAVALAYRDPDDRSAVALERAIDAGGLEGAMETICGIQHGERLSQRILQASEGNEPV